MTSALLWLHGINGQTKMNDIGWVYVILALMILLLAVLGYLLWQAMRR